MRNSNKNLGLLKKTTTVLRPFSAPEGHNNNKLFNEKECKAMDVYSLGMCILNFCGVPLKRIQPLSISVQEIHDYQLEKIFNEFLIKSYNWHIVEILKGMLKFDVNERWNIEQVWISLKALRNSSNNGKTLEADDKPGSDRSILQRFLRRFGSNINSDRKENNSQNSDNDSTGNHFSSKLSTKNVTIHLMSREDYKTFLNVKPMKNYK